jgi:parallel beta-helix repeat protein
MSTVYETKNSKSQIALAIGSAIASGALTMPVQAAEPCSPVGTTYMVTSSDPGTGTGTLRAAFSDANQDSACDQIEFDPSISAITLTDEFTYIAGDLNIVGPGKGSLAITNTNTSAGALTILSGDVHISNLTFKDSNRGVLAYGSATVLTLDSVLVKDNADYGVRGNDIASLTIKNSEIINNTGSGVQAYGNYTTANTLALNIENSTISDNSGGSGAGVNLDSRASGIINAVLRQNTISGNTASGQGGGIYMAGSSSMSQLRIESSTIANNSSDSNGGGIYMFGNGSTISLHNSLVAKNTTTGDGANLSGTFTTATYSWIGNNGGIPLSFTTPPATDTVVEGDETTLLLGDLADNGGTTQTHLPLEDSPLIDAGMPNAIEGNTAGQVLSLDQRQSQRVAGNSIDIGAVETTVAATEVAETTATTAVTGSSSSSSMGMILLSMLSGLLVWRRKQ